MRLLTALSNDLGSWILLFTSVIDIATSDINVSFFILVTILLSIIIDLGWTLANKECFCGLPLGLGSLAGAIYFAVFIFNSYLANNFAFCSDLLIYGLLTMTTYFIWGAHIRKYLVISRLYPIKIPFQTFS